MHADHQLCCICMSGSVRAGEQKSTETSVGETSRLAQHDAGQVGRIVFHYGTTCGADFALLMTASLSGTWPKQKSLLAESQRANTGRRAQGLSSYTFVYPQCKRPTATFRFIRRGRGSSAWCKASAEFWKLSLQSNEHKCSIVISVNGTDTLKTQTGKQWFGTGDAWPEIDQRKRSEVRRCRGTDWWVAEGGQLDCTLPLAALLRQNCKRRGQSSVCTNYPILLRGHCASAQENVTQMDSRSPREHYAKKKDKAGDCSEGHSCQTSACLNRPPDTKWYTVLIHCLRAPLSPMCSFTDRRTHLLLPLLSPLCQGGADGGEVRHKFTLVRLCCL